MNLKSAALVGFAILMTACASVKEASLKVSPGSSKENVFEAMGTPEDRQFNGEMEAWQYSNIASIGICEYTVVWFRSGLVTGLTTYRNGSGTGCRVGMQSIKWEAAPDAIVEIRQR